MKTFTLLALAFLGLVADGVAAIPRTTELELQAAAPERLEIEVLKVAKHRKVRALSQYRVTVSAKVLKVVRSASGVKVGSVITLSYSTPAVPTPSAPPGLVKKSGRYAAFLRKNDDGSYRDAAASGTFDPLEKE